jgi:5,10-methylenetetrahydromethanopterin reductase
MGGPGPPADRVAVGLGSGFTGRLALGQRPMPWRDVETYVHAFRLLLRGQDTEWDGAAIRMLQGGDFGAAGPVEVPLLIAANGPKGLKVAGELADGVFTTGGFLPDVRLPPWHAHLVYGTVIEDGEDPAGDRVLQAAGHGLAVAYHGSYELGGPAAVERLPGGTAQRTPISCSPSSVA